MAITLALITSTTILLAVRSLVAASFRIDRMLADLEQPPAPVDEPAAAKR